VVASSPTRPTSPHPGGRRPAPLWGQVERPPFLRRQAQRLPCLLGCCACGPSIDETESSSSRRARLRLRWDRIESSSQGAALGPPPHTTTWHHSLKHPDRCYDDAPATSSPRHLQLQLHFLRCHLWSTAHFSVYFLVNSATPRENSDKQSLGLKSTILGKPSSPIDCCAGRSRSTGLGVSPFDCVARADGGCCRPDPRHSRTAARNSEEGGARGWAGADRVALLHDSAFARGAGC
jgi:hypothetical protein